MEYAHNMNGKKIAIEELLFTYQGWIKMFNSYISNSKYVDQS